MLSTVPSNLKSPQWLAEQAEALADEHGLTCEIWDEKALEKHGFGGTLGSVAPANALRGGAEHHRR